mgnify:CR=1 FL=1|tara:strand:+ start:330 stop:635 length:306 start_codon:yes stop_codon:yes gene_type:complete
MANYLDKLLPKQKGFLGYETARENIGITVSYWENLEDVKAWKENEIHIKAQEIGKRIWYEDYTVRIAKVEKEYSDIISNYLYITWFYFCLTQMLYKKHTSI